MPRHTRLRLCSLVLLASAATAACGYALAGRGSFLPTYIRIVDIPPIENRTAAAGFEQILTERIQSEFIGRGRYTVQSEGADAVLRGEILSITQNRPTGLNEQQLASRYRLTVTMRVSFEDLRAGEVIWRNDALSFSEEYELSGALDGTVVDQQRSSFERIATDVARSVVTAIMEAF
jgi:hypothetical protein